MGAPVSFVSMTIPAGVRGSIWVTEEGLVPYRDEIKGNWQPGGSLTWKRFVVGPTKINFPVNPTVPQKFFIFVPEATFCCGPADQVDPVEWTWEVK